MLKKALADKDVKELVVAQEHHVDEGLHLHAYVRLGSRYTCRGAHETLKLGDHYPNVQATKNKVHWIKYLNKEDKEPHCEGIDINQFLEAKKNHKKVLGKRLLTGELTVREAVEDDPSLLFDYKRLKMNLDSYMRDKRADREDCKDAIPNTWDLDLAIKEGKKRHIWIFSYEPDKGKTTWLKGLDEKYRCSWYNYQESFQSVKEGTQFLLMDEFSSPHLKVTQINQMCDGTYCYPQKGEEAIQANLTMIVVGNRHPQEIYPNAFKFIEARFDIYEIN